MSQNVAEVLESRASTLFEKLGQNQDLANVIMGFLGRIVLMCHQMGKPIQGVDAGGVNASQGEIRFALSFNTLVISPMGLWQPQGDILSYAQSRSAHLAKVLERNGRLVRVFSEVVTVAEKMCQTKGIAFKNFKVKKAFIHPKTNVCIIRSGQPELSDRFR